MARFVVVPEAWCNDHFNDVFPRQTLDSPQA